MMALGAINSSCILYSSTLGHRAMSFWVDKTIRGDGFTVVGVQGFPNNHGTFQTVGLPQRPALQTRFLIWQPPMRMDQRLPEKQNFPTLHLPILLDQADKALQQLPGRRAKMRHRPGRGREGVHGAPGGNIFILCNRFFWGVICSMRNNQDISQMTATFRCHH